MLSPTAYEREARRRGVLPPAYITALFAQQRAFLDDPSTLKTARCGRRAGKSHASACYLLREAERHASATCVYIALTRKSAKRIMWDDPQSGLLALRARFDIDCTPNHSDLLLTFPNGSRVFLVGADDVQAIERLRGSRYRLAIVDEAASFGPSRLTALVRDVLRPATLDERGTIALVGTPGLALFGLFFDATTGKAPGWSQHTWTALDNPHVRDAQAFFDEERRINGWALDHPTFRREYLGEWVLDASGLVYPFDFARNGIVELPESKVWTRVLGVDYGFGNATSAGVLAWRPHDPNVYGVASAKRSGLTPSGAAEWVREFEREHGAFAQIVGDVGGLGKAYAEEARQRFAIPITPAQKSDKRAAQELLAGDMLAGRFKLVISRNAALIDEMAVLQWGPQREEEDDRFENDLCDGNLYAWRAAKAWLATHETPAVVATEQEQMQARTFDGIEIERETFSVESW